MKPINVIQRLNESTWCGVPGTIYRYHGDWSDPEVEYDGKLYNEWDLQEYIGDSFNDYVEENGIDLHNDWHGEFAKWLKDNPDYAYSAFNDLEPVVHNDSKFEPTNDDWNDINHWYNDDPKEDWELGRTNDYYNKGE